jgi:hypothetical protein
MKIAAVVHAGRKDFTVRLAPLGMMFKPGRAWEKAGVGAMSVNKSTRRSQASVASSASSSSLSAPVSPLSAQPTPFPIFGRNPTAVLWIP